MSPLPMLRLNMRIGGSDSTPTIAFAGPPLAPTPIQSLGHSGRSSGSTNDRTPCRTEQAWSAMLVWVDRALKRKSHSCSRNGDKRALMIPGMPSPGDGRESACAEARTALRDRDLDVLADHPPRSSAASTASPRDGA